EPEQSGIAPNKLEYYTVDAAIVMQSMILAATNEGLGTCWIGWFDEPEVKSVLSIPESYSVIGITPLGYPASQPSPKDRKKIEEICFSNAFGNKWLTEIPED
ncbi:MAG: nitroreductase family protein, partial [Promethearchaeota archaeon]